MSDKNQKTTFANKLKELAASDESDNFFSSNQNNQPALADPYPIAPVASTQEVHDTDAPHHIDLREDEQWFADDDNTYEGQLAIDVYQDKKNIYVKAAIAGVRPEDIDIQLNNDMITIKGKRKHCHEDIEEEDYYIKECYWGGFSRSVILPVDIKTDQVKATIENGLLTVELPKSKRPRNTRIEVKEVKK